MADDDLRNLHELLRGGQLRSAELDRGGHLTRDEAGRKLQEFGSFLVVVPGRRRFHRQLHCHGPEGVVEPHREGEEPLREAVLGTVDWQEQRRRWEGLKGRLASVEHGREGATP